MVNMNNFFSNTFPSTPKFLRKHEQMMSSAAQVCRLLNLTTYFGKNFKKHCSDGQYEQLCFKYFPIHALVFEKM
jgi:hypothetical protein